MAEWYEKNGASWSAQDRDAARTHLAAGWAAVTGDAALPPLTYPAGTPAPHLLDAIVGGRGFAGSKSPGHYAAYVSVHVGSHVLFANTDADTTLGRMAAWLQDPRGPAYRRLRVVAYKVESVPDEEVGGLVVLFCGTDLKGVLRTYERDELFWPYLTTSFRNFVAREARAVRRWNARATQLDTVGEPGDIPDRPQTDLETSEPPAELDEQVRRDLAAALRKLTGEELGKHGGTLSDQCAACLGIKVLQRSYGQEERPEHAAIAAELGISEGNCRVLLTRTLHRLREDLAAYPVALEAESNAWRVRLNRRALWDTLIRVSCEPADLASSTLQQVTVPQGMNRAIDTLTLRTTPYHTTRPTAVIFAGGCDAGDVAVGTLHFDQARLVASANGREVNQWVEVPPRTRTTGPRRVTLSASDAVARFEVDGVGGKPPLVAELPPGTTVTPVRVLTGNAPGPADITVEPRAIVGGADEGARAIVVVGARIVAQTADARAEGVLAITPTAARMRIAMTSADPQHVRPGKARRIDNSAMFEAALTAESVAARTDVVIVASDGRQEARGLVAVLPPPLAALRLPAKRIRAGTSVVGSVHSRIPVAAPEGLRVTLVTTHSGIVLEPAEPVIACGAREASFTCVAITDARQGLARIAATAGDVAVTANLEVVPNGIKSVTFEPRTVKGGATAMGTVLCHHPLPEIATIRVISTDGLAVLGSQTVAIPKNSTKATFRVNTKPVTRPLTLEIVADGLGARVAGRLRVTP
jgi:hypothetical protein